MGLRGGHDLRDQDCQEEGESPDRSVNNTVTAEMEKVHIFTHKTSTTCSNVRRQRLDTIVPAGFGTKEVQCKEQSS